jgi:potassium-dependent mechanosensitive channel
LLVLPVLLLAAWGPASAQTLPQQVIPESSPPTPSMASTAGLGGEIAAKRAALQAEFAALRQRLEAASQSDSYADRGSLLQEVDLLRQLERLYGQQTALAQLGSETAAEGAKVAEELRQVRAAGVPGPRPFSFLYLDRLEDELDAETGRVANLDAGVEFATEALEQARQSLDTAERARRAAQETLEVNRDGDKTEELTQQLRMLRLASQVAGEEVRLRELELANARIERDVHHSRMVLLGEQVQWVSRDVRLSDEELREQTTKLENEEFEVAQSLDQVRQRMMSPEAMAASGDGGAGHDRRQTLQLRFTVVSQRLQQLADMKQLWSRRLALARGSYARDELPQWERDARRQVEAVDREERRYTARLIQLRRSTQSAESGDEEASARTPEEQRESDERIRILETALSNVESFGRAQERLLAQIVAVTKAAPLADRIRQGWRGLSTAWDYELVAVQDRPITVGKVVLGILLFLAGIYVSRWVSRFLGRRVWPRFGLDPGASAALQSLSYYVLVVIMTLIALQVVNVPLTLFTFVGGALAIGIGFGSQNLMNNFISGLILLAERPIKVGDLVEIGEMRGTVESIGARSTKVRSHKNIHVIVPNSHFLEKEVVNWTLADDSVKTSVAVGIADGSPLDKIQELLIEAVSNHEKIFTTPAPAVLLRNFGESALEFEVFFWVRIRSSMEMWTIESDVRLRIDRLFREHGIETAFPQRDVHLETKGPLEVRVRRE